MRLHCLVIMVREGGSSRRDTSLTATACGCQQTFDAGLQMLESAMPRQAITTRSFGANPALRSTALMAGEFAATVW